MFIVGLCVSFLLLFSKENTFFLKKVGLCTFGPETDCGFCTAHIKSKRHSGPVVAENEGSGRRKFLSPRSPRNQQKSMYGLDLLYAASYVDLFAKATPAQQKPTLSTSISPSFRVVAQSSTYRSTDVNLFPIKNSSIHMIQYFINHILQIR